MISKKLQFKSIALRLVFAICTVVTLSLIAVGTYSYLSISKKVEVMLGERLEHMVRTGTLLIDPNDHESIEVSYLEQEENIPETPAFKRVKDQLEQIKKINDLSVEVYTVIGPDWAQGNMIFIAMSGEKNFTGNSLPLNETVQKVIKTGLPQHTDLYEDEEGLWVSAMAPIKNKDGKVISVLEVDYKAEAEVSSAKKEVLIAIGGPALIAFVCAVGLGIYLGKSLAKPVISLSNAASKVASGDLTTKVEITTNDEIGSLSQIFNSMTSELKTSREQLEDYAKNLEEKVKERTAEVVAGKKKIENILDNIEQGVVTFSDNLSLDDEFSAFVSRFYQIPKDEIAGQPYYDFLFPQANLTSNESNLMVESIKAIIGEDDLAWSLNSDHLPHELVIKINEEEKIIGVDWTPMLSPDGIVERLMVVIKDLTQQRALELQLETERKEGQKMVDNIIEMMRHPKQKIVNFISDSIERLESVESNLNDKMDLNQMFIDLHTMKGAASVLSKYSVTNSTHEAEEPVQKLRSSEDNTSHESILREKFLNLKEDFHRFQETFKKVYEGNHQSEESSTFLTILSQHVEGISKRLKENSLQFSLIGLVDAVVDWPTQYMKKLSDVLIHALNNSIDHGYLLPISKGLSLNQPEIKVVAQRENSENILLTIEDSGVGLDIDLITSAAKKKGLWKEGMSQESVINLLFMDGFSTAESTSETSGRGVGLSAIKKFIQDLDGTVSIENRKDRQGSRLSFILPINPKV